MMFTCDLKVKPQFKHTNIHVQLLVIGFALKAFCKAVSDLSSPARRDALTLFIFTDLSIRYDVDMIHTF